LVYWSPARAGLALAASGAGLRDDEAARSGQEDYREQAFGFHGASGVADDFVMRARVVDEDDAVWVDLWEEPADFLFADVGVRVGEEEIDGAVDFHLKAGLIAEFHPWFEGRCFEAFFGAGVDNGVELAADDFAEAVAFEAAGDPFGGDAEEGAGFDDEPRLDGGDEGGDELEHLGLGGHGVDHAPVVRLGALGRGAMHLRLELASGAVVLQHDLVFLLQLFAE
jgi:hypothetical protein